MSGGIKVLTVLFLALAIASQMLPAASLPASAYGTGIRAYVPTVRSANVDQLPFTYNGSFVVYNDGYRNGVYIIRVGVTEPTSINWLNLSESVFTLRPGETRIISFSFNVTNETARPGNQEFIFTPTLLTTSVEPYLDDFANYESSADSFRFWLNVTGISPVVSNVTSIIFVPTNHTNFVQYSILQNTSKVVTQLDRAIKLNVGDKAAVGEPIPLSISIFESLSKRGLSMLAVSPDGTVYPVSEGNVTFDSPGLWGIVVQVGDEMILGKTIDVTPVRSPLAGIDAGTLLAGLSLLILLSLVPLWTLAPGRQAMDPYEDVIYRAYVVRKYIDRFDAARLRSAVKMLRTEYDGLVARDARGKRAAAKKAIAELETLAEIGSESGL